MKIFIIISIAIQLLAFEDVTSEQVTQELAQVKTLIAIETKKKEEVTKKELAAIALETQKLNSQALRVKKDAEAYANKKLVNAGLTPQEEAQIIKETKIGVAKAFAGPTGLQLPSTYFSGGGTSGNAGGSNDMLSQIMTMMLANDLKLQSTGKNK